jgi:adenosylmethionine-8-amino-7-oxononanoate aminotransferase
MTAMPPETPQDRWTARLVELDNTHVWHPFTPMRQWLEGGDEPGRLIVAGEGFELIDQAGRRYIDGFSSLWCNLHGHRVPQIDQAICSQLEKIAHSTLLGHACPPSIELAERLARIAPAGLTKVFYSDSGASAVEVATKSAFQYFRNIGQAGRQRFIALREGYHGDTLGAMSLGGIDTFHTLFRPLLFETTFVDSPNAYHHPAGEQAGRAVLDQIAAILERAGDSYCAVITEPMIQAAGGMLTHRSGFLRGLRELTERQGLLLIADEVATGFCRTGRLFACNHEDVSPDILCLGKGLTGGYLPVAATLTSRKVFDAFRGAVTEGKTFYHGHTYTGNALGCAAGVASIDLIFSSGLLDGLAEKARLMGDRLAELRDHRHVADIRQCGLMVGIELADDRKRRRGFDPAMQVGAAVCRAARKRGILTRPLGDVVVLMPAPAMDMETLERLLRGIIETIQEHFAAGTV